MEGIRKELSIYILPMMYVYASIHSKYRDSF